MNKQIKQYDPDGRISRGAYIAQAMLEYFVTIATTGTFLTNLLNYLEFSTASQGIISSVASLMFVAELVSVLTIRKRTGVKRMIIVMTVLNQFFFAMLYFTPFFKINANIKSAIFLVMISLGYIFWYLPTPFRTAWQMSNVDNHKRGVFTAKKEIVSLIGGFIFTFVMGRLIDSYQARGDIEGSFLICGITALGLATLNVICLFMIKENAAEDKAGQIGFTENLKRSWNATMKNKGFRVVLLINSVYHIAAASNYFSGTYQRNVLGFSMGFISLLTLLYSICRSLVSIPLGKLADKKGWVNMLVPCFVLSGIAYLINVFTVPGTGFITYTIYYCLYAAAMGGMNSGMLNLAFEYVEKSNRTDAVAWQAAVGGLTGFLASLVMSFLVDTIEENGNTLFGINAYPQQVLYLISAVLFVVLVISAVFLKKIKSRA